MASLAVSRPESTVKPLDLEPREQMNSRQGSRLPTRERMGSRGRPVLADPSQMLTHRKSQIAKQQLAEAREREACLEQEKELKKQEKMMRQKEIEEKMGAVLEQEQEEIRRQRQLKEEVLEKCDDRLKDLLLAISFLILRPGEKLKSLKCKDSC